MQLFSKTAQNILLFLFVNEESYASQMKTHLNSTLSVIQNALFRLEKAQIITSHYEKNRKMYRLDSDCPYRWELEALLKKMYILSTSEEKKQFHFLHKTDDPNFRNPSSCKTAKKVLTQFWQRLIAVSHLNLTYRSRKESASLIQKATAHIDIQMPHAKTVIFNEKGAWIVNQHAETSFTNSFLWHLDLENERISLSHLRHGKETPVFLLYFAVTKQGLLESVDPHLCKEDTYLGSILWNAKEIQFQWRVIGPKKNDEMLYHYT